jgi:hypothetical protein
MQRITRPGTRLRLLVAVAAIAGFMVVPATGQAAFKFGSKLTSEVQPSNAGSGHYCVDSNHGQKCTWVMNEAYGRPNGGEKSPKNGTITKIRLIAQVGGSFQLQIVQAKKAGDDWKAKVVRKGPIIHFDGQPDPDEPYLVESFNVHLAIKKGQRLAIKTNRTSLLRCSSGGDNTLLYKPPLVGGQAFRKNTDDSGCWMLIEAVANPASQRVGGTLRATHN